MTTIEVKNLHKSFGDVHAVNDVSFRVPSGRVAGILGNNGAGKTTTMRMLLGLIRPDAGYATFGGTAYRDLTDPTREVGTVLEPGRLHPGRRAEHHLTVLAQAAGIPVTRVSEALERVGLAQAAERRVGGFSLGMRQRLGIAAALMGDPGVLILDEPTNGLDPEGVRWVRSLTRSLGDEGRTVLVSSHNLAEVARSVDEIVVLHHGHLVAHEDVTDADDLETRFHALTDTTGGR